jgi:hypothetical protein
MAHAHQPKTEDNSLGGILYDQDEDRKRNRINETMYHNATLPREK